MTIWDEKSKNDASLCMSRALDICTSSLDAIDFVDSGVTPDQVLGFVSQIRLQLDAVEMAALWAQ